MKQKINQIEMNPENEGHNQMYQKKARCVKIEKERESIPQPEKGKQPLKEDTKVGGWRTKFRRVRVREKGKV